MKKETTPALELDKFIALPSKPYAYEVPEKTYQNQKEYNQNLLHLNLKTHYVSN